MARSRNELSKGYGDVWVGAEDDALPLHGRHGGQRLVYVLCHMRQHECGKRGLGEICESVFVELRTKARDSECLVLSTRTVVWKGPTETT